MSAHTRDYAAGVGLAILTTGIVAFPIPTLVTLFFIVALPGAFWLGRLSASRRHLAVEDDVIEGEWREL